MELLTCMQPQRQVRYKQDRLLLRHPVPVSSYPGTEHLTASALRMLVPACSFLSGVAFSQPEKSIQPDGMQVRWRLELHNCTVCHRITGIERGSRWTLEHVSSVPLPCQLTLCVDISRGLELWRWCLGLGQLGGMRAAGEGKRWAGE